MRGRRNNGASAGKVLASLRQASALVGGHSTNFKLHPKAKFDLATLLHPSINSQDGSCYSQPEEGSRIHLHREHPPEQGTCEVPNPRLRRTYAYSSLEDPHN